MDTQAAGSNRRFSHEVTTLATSAQVWTLWMDVGGWKRWDQGLKDAMIDGPLALGARGKIVPLSGPAAAFRVAEFDEGRAYAFVTTLPAATLTVRRTLVAESPQVRFRHEVQFDGLLAGFWAARFGPTFRAALPPTMARLAALAEAE